MTYTVAVVGTGPNPNQKDTDGYAMAYRHAAGYRRLEDCSLTACSDIVRENAEQFADWWGVSGDNVYEDTVRMIREVAPDIVSVCVPPHIHAPVVTDIAETGIPAAIHCEKPMAGTWGECREMVDLCSKQNIQLTFNHQRRFGKPFRKAKELLESGRIGQLERVEIGGDNLFDYGSHLFDLCGFYTEQRQPAWVLAGIDYSVENVLFGAHNENQAIVQWEYENGISGLASTGAGSFMSCQLHLVGASGVIEIGGEEAPLRVKSGSGWKTVDTGRDDIHGPNETTVEAAKQKLLTLVPFASADTSGPPSFIDRAIAEVVESLDEGTKSELAAENALQSTELIFGAWESARQQGRVSLPLDISDNPLESMVENGTMLDG
jgi:predicted dehydrogenase